MLNEQTTKTAAQNSNDDQTRCATMSALARHKEQMQAAHDRVRDTHRAKQKKRHELGRHDPPVTL